MSSTIGYQWHYSGVLVGSSGTCGTGGLFIVSLIISVISLSIHDKLIKEDYIDKFKSKSEKEFADMMVGSAEKLVTENGQKNIDKDIENFLSKEY